MASIGGRSGVGSTRAPCRREKAAPTFSQVDESMTDMASEKALTSVARQKLYEDWAASPAPKRSTSTDTIESTDRFSDIKHCVNLLSKLDPPLSYTQFVTACERLHNPEWRAFFLAMLSKHRLYWAIHFVTFLFYYFGYSHYILLLYSYWFWQSDIYCEYFLCLCFIYYEYCSWHLRRYCY